MELLTRDFKCSKCHHIQERLIRSEKETPDCILCGNYTVKYTNPNVQNSVGNSHHTK